MKTELKNCLSLYKIFYSCAFILILCVIHPIIYYEEIGSAIQSPIAFLTIIFCSDTYLMEVKSKGKPNENCVLDNDITLEDAYIYLTNS